VEVPIQVARDFIKGDSQAVEQVYVAYRRLLYFIIVSIVKNEEDANDVFEELFASFLSKEKSLSDPARLNFFLEQSARNAAINFAKKRDSLIDYTDLMDVYGEDEQDNSYLQSLLEGLSDLENIVFAYKIVYGFSFREIERLTGIPRQNAHRLYGKALKKARRLYGVKKT
jgi:RNA polymerase sigma-70 factor (ECF subfamily)